jgi:hypothetical protein
MSFCNRARSLKQVRILGTLKFRPLLSYQIPVAVLFIVAEPHSQSTLPVPALLYFLFFFTVTVHNTVHILKDMSRSRVSFSLPGAQAALSFSGYESCSILIYATRAEQFFTYYMLTE